jgi:hypothetical protein
VPYGTDVSDLPWINPIDFVSTDNIVIAGEMWFNECIYKHKQRLLT